MSLSLNLDEKWKYILSGLGVGVGSFLACKALFQEQVKQFYEPINRNIKNIKYESEKWEQSCFQIYNPKEEILIPQPDVLKNKLRAAKKGGLHNLQIVSDFDQTISSFYKDQDKKLPVPATFGCFKASGILSQSMNDRLQADFEKYYPMEIDNSLSYEQKKQAMIEWGEGTEQILLDENLTRELVKKVMNKTNLCMRYSFDDFFRSCQRINLPFYIVSGGIDTFIASLLNHITCLNNYRNFFLFSNQLIYSRKGKLIDVHMIIDATSKSKILDQQEFEFYDTVIQFGDSNHDIFMAKTMGCKTVISILFLRDSQRDKYQEFVAKGWDIIITQGDGGFVVPLFLLEFISGNKNIIDIKKQDREVFKNNPTYKKIRSILQEASFEI